MTPCSDPDAQHMGTLWLLKLNEPLPVGTEPRVPTAFTHVGPEAAQELAQAMGFKSQAPILRRFNEGKHGYVGRVDGNIATYGWVSFEQEGIGELGLSMRFNKGEAYIWDCSTLVAYRGLRLFPALLAYIIDQLHSEGLQRVWIGADTDNVNSQSGFRHAGFQPIADIMQTTTSGSNTLWMRGHTGAPEEDVAAARALFGDGVM